MRWLVGVAVLLALTGSSPLLAQPAAESARVGPSRSLAAAAPSTGGAFLIETAGGVIGSGAGMGLGIWLATVDECDGEDLSCTLERVGVALGLSTIGAGAGAWLAGRIGSTRPSGWGAAVGALLGVPAGLGVVHLISEDLDWVSDDTIEVVTYVVTQGLVAALFSRIGAALRD